MRAISQARAHSVHSPPAPGHRRTRKRSNTNLFHSLSCALADIVLVRPGARVRQMALSLKAAPMLTSPMITGESQNSRRVRTRLLGETVGQWRKACASALPGNRRPDGSSTPHCARRHRSGFRLSDAKLLLTARPAILFYWQSRLARLPSSTGGFRRQGTRPHSNATVLIMLARMPLAWAIPLVIAISTSLGAQNGLLVRTDLALERARNLDLVIFDKTEP